jgi:hypothetical protein
MLFLIMYDIVARFIILTNLDSFLLLVYLVRIRILIKILLFVALGVFLQVRGLLSHHNRLLLG